MSTLAFLGTGTMGLPMARHLAGRGFEVRVWNRTWERARPLEAEGAVVCEQASEAVRGAELMVTMLSDTDAVLEVARHSIDQLSADGIWIQCSTIGLDGIRRCQDLAAQAGVVLVDAPVLGTREPAEQAKLVVLASGPQAALRRCAPMFDAIGQRTLELGESGAGSRCKVVINSWIVSVVGALAETLALAEGLGIDPNRFFEAVEGGPLDLPYARMKGELMIERCFDHPAFRLALARKDADLVLAAAAQAGLELPIMEAAARRMHEAERTGHGDEDMAATYWASAPETLMASGHKGG